VATRAAKGVVMRAGVTVVAGAKLAVLMVADLVAMMMGAAWLVAKVEVEGVVAKAVMGEVVRVMGMVRVVAALVVVAVAVLMVTVVAVVLVAVLVVALAMGVANQEVVQST